MRLLLSVTTDSSTMLIRSNSMSDGLRVLTLTLGMRACLVSLQSLVLGLIK